VPERSEVASGGGRWYRGGSGRGGESMLFGGNSIYIIRYRKIRLSRVFFKSGVLFFKMEVVLPLAESLGGMLYGCKTVG